MSTEEIAKKDMIRELNKLQSDFNNLFEFYYSKVKIDKEIVNSFSIIKKNLIFMQNKLI